MLLPFRLRLAFCALSACVLSACGGGGDAPALASANARASVDDEVYLLDSSTDTTPDKFTMVAGGGVDVDTFGTDGAYQIGYLTYYSDAVELNVGYLKGNKQKFVVGVEKAGDPKIYECISSAWTAEDKAALMAEYKAVPATCAASQITLDSSTDQFSMVRAAVPSASGGKIYLTLTKKLLPIFPS